MMNANVDQARRFLRLWLLENDDRRSAQDGWHSWPPCIKEDVCEMMVEWAEMLRADFANSRQKAPKPGRGRRT